MDIGQNKHPDVKRIARQKCAIILIYAHLEHEFPTNTPGLQISAGWDLAWDVQLRFLSVHPVPDNHFTWCFTT